MRDGDPFGNVIPDEHQPTSFLTDDEFEVKFRAWMDTHESDRDDTPDPFDW